MDDLSRLIDCSDDAVMMCDDADPTRAVFVCRGRRQDSDNRDYDDSELKNQLEIYINQFLFFAYLLLLLWGTLMSRWMMEGWWEVGGLEGVGWLVHGGSMGVVTRRQSTRSAGAAARVRRVCRTAAAQANAAAMTREAFLWKRKLLSPRLFVTSHLRNASKKLRKGSRVGAFT